MFLYRSNLSLFKASHTTTGFWGVEVIHCVSYWDHIGNPNNCLFFSSRILLETQTGKLLFSWSKSTDQGTVHSFPTSGVVCLDFNESRDLWLCRLVGSLLFVKSLTLLSLLHLLMLPNRKATAVEPPAATTSRKRPPLLSDQFSKLPNVSKSNHYI